MSLSLPKKTLRKKSKSVIKEKLLRKALLKGTLIATCGLSLIVIAAFTTFATYLGLISFILGLGLIAFGLLPYKKLSKLQLNPHEIQNDGQNLLFIKGGKPLFKIDLISIQKIEYVERNDLYGLGIILKKPLKEKIKILQPQCPIQYYSCEGYDLFLPYFLKNVVNEIILNENNKLTN